MIHAKAGARRYPLYAWMNGQVIPWEQCVLHVRTQAVFFGSNIFEGLRAYWSEAQGQLFVFRVREHLERLGDSMKAMRMRPPYTPEELAEGLRALLSANGFREDVQLNIVTYFGFTSGDDPLFPSEETGAHITAIPFSRSPKVHSGAAACISSWRRISDDSVPPRVKVGSNYQNSRLAQTQARTDGYDTAIFLNSRGKVSEAPGACLLMVRKGRIYTPPITADILEGITRDTLMVLSEEKLGLPVIERDIDRTELYTADEVLVCGSIAEVLPITSLDRIPIGGGEVGPLTRRLQELYFAALVGELGDHRCWLTPVYEEGR